MSLLLLFNGSVQGTAGSFPDVYLEVAFTTNPGEPPVWERIPLADIRSIDINRGRSRELDQFQAGRMTCVLDNRDRLYDPNYTAGSHFGDVLPNRRIRLRAVWDTTYDLFSGYVDNWGQQWDHTNEATVVVGATDGFKVLQRADLQSSAYATEVQADSPIHWWRLGEAVGATTAFDSVGSANATVINTVVFGTAGLISRETDTAATFETAVPGYLSAPGVTARGTGSFSVTFVIRDSSTVVTRPILTTPGSGTTNFQAKVTAAGAITWIVGASALLTSTGTPLGDGLDHHVALLRQDGGTLKIYVDGVDVTPSVEVDTTDLTATGFYMGQDSGGLADPFNGILDEMAIFDYALSEERIAAQSAQVATPWNGDTSGERIERLLDLIEWPDADRDVDTGDSTLQSADIAGQTVLAHAQLVTDSEYGELWLTPDGKVKFLSRTNKLTLGTPEATFSDDGSDTGYTQLGADYSDQQIRNRVTISRNEGLSFTVNSTASQDQFFIQSYSKTGLIHDSDVQSRDQANYIAAVYDEPLFRFDDLTVRPQKTPATWFPVVLGLDLVDRVNVERTPQDVGTAIDDNYIIEGVRHTIRPKLWESAYFVSPADDPGAFILDSTSQGILDTNRLGF